MMLDTKARGRLFSRFGKGRESEAAHAFLVTDKSLSRGAMFTRGGGSDVYQRARMSFKCLRLKTCKGPWVDWIEAPVIAWFT